jgi:hypothetical protein
MVEGSRVPVNPIADGYELVRATRC